MIAPDDDLSSPDDCVDGLLDVYWRLGHHFGLRVRWASLGPDVNGRFIGPTRTVIVNSDTPLGDQLWQLVQVWQYLAIGPGATPDAMVTPALRLVDRAM